MSWEYKSDIYTGGPPGPEVLNECGKEGWELVSLLVIPVAVGSPNGILQRGQPQVTAGILCVFKKPVCAHAELAQIQ